MKLRVIAFTVLGLCVAASLFFAYQHNHQLFALFDTGGTIAESQKHLMIVATLLMLIVVLPVFVLTAFIAIRYREGNKKRVAYTPNWDHNRKLEAVWWGVPLFVILLLSGVIWTSTHELDPYKPIVSDKSAVEIKVVALQWRWLFIYPGENIATINEVHFPVDRPVNFKITADAPMNSFWIPRLGGQIYAMPGMETKLHLMANAPGTYEGLSANISGEGFSNMRFSAVAESDQQYEAWLKSVKDSDEVLTSEKYETIAAPNSDRTVKVYSSADVQLYDTIIAKYMMPEGGYKKEQTDGSGMEAMRH